MKPWNGIEINTITTTKTKKHRQNNWFDWYGRLSWTNNINKNKESFWSWNVVLEIDYYHFQMILQLWGWTSLFAVSQRLMTWKWWVAEILSLKYSLLLKWNLWNHPQFCWGGKVKPKQCQDQKCTKTDKKMNLVLLILVNRLFAVFWTILKGRADSLHFQC